MGELEGVATLIIGTWNMNRRKPTDLHLEVLCNRAYDVWLLTEVHSDWQDALRNIDDTQFFLSASMMAKHQHWAAILCHRMTLAERLPAPHPASVAVRCNDITFCASVLPWKDASAEEPWTGHNHAARVQSTLRTLMDSLPREKLVWGGDWNHALDGHEVAGNKQGRMHLLDALQELGLTVPTASLPSRVDGFQGERYLSIDHIAIPASWTVLRTQHIPCYGLSDHHAYKIDVNIT